MNIAPYEHCACGRMANTHSLCAGELIFREAGKQVRLDPRRDERAIAVVLDGCVFQDDRLKCDGLFLWRGRNKKAAVLVELKGAHHIAHAFEQLAYVQRERSEYHKLLATLDALPGGVPQQVAIIVSNGMLTRPEHERLENTYGIRVRAVVHCEPTSTIPDVREHLQRSNASMTLRVETPGGYALERDSILSVLLSDFLGLPWLREVGERQDVRITLDGQPGEIWLPDSLFSVADAGWMAESSMPRRPLARWDAHELTTDITLVEPIVPVIYGGCYRRRKTAAICRGVNP